MKRKKIFSLLLALGALLLMVALSGCGKQQSEQLYSGKKKIVSQLLQDKEPRIWYVFQTEYADHRSKQLAITDIPTKIIVVQDGKDHVYENDQEGYNDDYSYDFGKLSKMSTAAVIKYAKKADRAYFKGNQADNIKYLKSSSEDGLSNKALQRSVNFIKQAKYQNPSHTINGYGHLDSTGNKLSYEYINFVQSDVLYDNLSKKALISKVGKKSYDRNDDFFVQQSSTNILCGERVADQIYDTTMVGYYNHEDDSSDSYTTVTPIPTKQYQKNKLIIKMDGPKDKGVGSDPA
ncbi:hypothetical protein IV38_GL001676 [Lactobacillus selangorensis]|uniref:Lipoprotein n=1 Tax=Lactobacillus selangorensis TaxID=81857 RepID=A0A0R2FTV7_9LACO|nr:hypothetical protein [Lactobacillus selangorensis]KRN28222.1 hypothetical protein IV38_GL001676 [Lactobacillus selangorensis]KRN30902.1 hypothetical protein IV40_GL001539 [Lactobacillus selangorensis]